MGRSTTPGSGHADPFVVDHQFRAGRFVQRLRAGHGRGKPTGNTSWFRPGSHADHQPGAATGSEGMDTVVVWSWRCPATRNTGAGRWTQYAALAGFRCAALSAFRADEAGGANDGCLVFTLEGVTTGLAVKRCSVRNTVDSYAVNLPATRSWYCTPGRCQRYIYTLPGRSAMAVVVWFCRTGHGCGPGVVVGYEGISAQSGSHFPEP